MIEFRREPGEYIDDWSTFRIPTPDMVTAFREHSRWKDRYERMCALQELHSKIVSERDPEAPPPEPIQASIDEAYHMMRKWEERSHRYVNANGGYLSMASGVHRNFLKELG